jgi:hypothetical protein
MRLAPVDVYTQGATTAVGARLWLLGVRGRHAAVARSYFAPAWASVYFAEFIRQEKFMRILLTSAIALTAMLAAGCDKPKSPDAVAHDVAAAEQKASTEVSNSEKDASKDIGSAADKVGDKLTDLNNVAAKDAEKVDIAKADGDRKVALARCSALGGDAQTKCRDEAEADYSAAKANAKADAVAAKQ